MSFELETATADASTLRRVAIDPVSRVEGHGKVTLLLDENDIVQQVRLHIVEFRGFEKFIQGRPYWEVPVMVQRLCGICPVSHHLAASKALDHVVGAPRLTPAADKLRRLMHFGQVMLSDALHFFHLSSPDLPIDTLLHRLFWEENLRRYDPGVPTFSCSCSRERVGRMLVGLGREEVDSVLAERGEVEIGCQFCGAQYRSPTPNSLPPPMRQPLAMTSPAVMMKTP